MDVMSSGTLDSQAVMNLPTWILGTEFGSSGRSSKLTIEPVLQLLNRHF